MNRRELFGIGFGALLPLPALAKPAPLTCQHEYHLWPRTAFGEDFTRQCVHCGERQRKKMAWCSQSLHSTALSSLYFGHLGEHAVSDWQPDGKFDPTWIRQIAGIQLR